MCSERLGMEMWGGDECGVEMNVGWKEDRGGDVCVVGGG